MVQHHARVKCTSMELVQNIKGQCGVDKLSDATSDCVYKRTHVWDLIRTFGQTPIPGSSNYRIVLIYDVQLSDNHPVV